MKSLTILTLITLTMGCGPITTHSSGPTIDGIEVTCVDKEVNVKHVNEAVLAQAEAFRTDFGRVPSIHVFVYHGIVDGCCYGDSDIQGRTTKIDDFSDGACTALYHELFHFYLGGDSGHTDPRWPIVDKRGAQISSILRAKWASQ